MYNKGEEEEIKMSLEVWIPFSDMVCSASGEVIARNDKASILKGVEELGFKLIANDGDVIVDCGCGGNMYRCGEPAK
jgi:hypothetical protein